MPLKHPPGEAQVDFGQAVVKMGGILRKIFFFVMALPYSDVFFVKAYDRECTETFWDGHVQAFQFFGGVAKPHSLPFARPFENFTLPKCFEILRNRMDSQMENGVKEYIRVLRMLETWSLKQLTSAVEKALRIRIHSADAIE